MAGPSALDLLVLTFNCAKSLIDIGVFAAHLQTAFKQHGGNAAAASGDGLPDVVVFSLQEVAPMSLSFIGPYFLTPYINAFDDAVNLAAIRHLHPDSDISSPPPRASSSRDLSSSSPSSSPSSSSSSSPSSPSSSREYKLIRSHNVGYTAIILFARSAATVKNLEEAEVGFGAADMGNKGAVALRFRFVPSGSDDEYDEHDDEVESTELTFVATHLAAMEWNLPRRNANWAAIVRGLAFENPEEILKLEQRKRTPSHAKKPTSPTTPSGEHVRLLRQDTLTSHLALRAKLHDISVFKPSSHLFVAGDLNYRISTTSPPINSTFPSLDPDDENYYPSFFPLDQLTRERKAGRTCHGLSEADVNFPPTYKYVVRSGGRDDLDVAWSWAPHRYPGWTDRILFLDVPRWVKRQLADGPSSGDPSAAARVDVLAYDALPLMRSSDHRAVFLRARVPLLPPSAMAPREDLLLPEDELDPRVRLPVEIDPEAWERRAAARRKEVMVGWSMYLWSTRQGAVVLAGLLVVGTWVWWVCRGV